MQPDTGARTVLAVGAHPDDVELLCAGTLALLRDRGWAIEVATMTPGDCGSATEPREVISAIRRTESTRSAAVLDGNYHCLECDDVFILYDRPTLQKVIGLLREVKPTIVFTMSPDDYMVDHEITSAVVRSACFSAGMKNIETGAIPPLPDIPALYYLDPVEGKDILGNTVQATTLVDITTAMARKERMFLCHESQHLWLKAHHGIDESVASMKTWAERRGKLIGVQFAEGFRQHLGHAYPQENILLRELNGLVHL